MDTLLKALTTHPDCIVFEGINKADTQDFNQLILRPVPGILTLPEMDKGYFLIKAIKTDEINSKRTFFMDFTFSEAVNDHVFILDNGSIRQIDTYEFGSVIPAIAYEGLHNYEIYYPISVPAYFARPNADIAIEILRNGLKNAHIKSAIAESLGYILRDEGRYEEALEALNIAIECGSCCGFVRHEADQLRRLIYRKKVNGYTGSFLEKNSE